MKSYQNNSNPFLYANKWSQLIHNWISKLINIKNHWLDELKQYPNKPSRFRATIYTVGWTPLIIGLLFISLKLTIISQPLLIIYLMDFFEPCSIMSIELLYYLIEIFAMEMRVDYHGLIYRKVLRLSSSCLNAFSSGEITNVFSNDASQIELIRGSLNYLWVIYIKRFYRNIHILF
ncbi:unnamed protein product [Rotaria sp. Silwood1]|nr:unnamed protein product [Rotaria sp. Silwood1]CAF1633109.1 unnamed protein product [Rotaria sp. Silwood1]CAF3775016.1 unnamed protein product [Rotaria sp. Silwood1]CAF4807709.1 unnamed protein product [Rotaria sp. Silwood1]CAF4813043.1 unnamed protein product [Rotaria sp. Silwood1]